MALIKCPNCGQDISDKAEKCPHCGWEKKREKKNKEGKFKMPSNQYCIWWNSSGSGAYLHYCLCWNYE